MNTNLIVTTHKSEIHSLAYGGFLVYENFHQITGILTPEQALFFAEPILHGNGRSIDWYTPIAGTVKKLIDLPEQEQAVARTAITDFAKQIREHADAIKNSSTSSQMARGHLLELALFYPDDTCLYSVNGHPVITCWGFGPGTPGAQPESLERMGLGLIPVPAPFVPQTTPKQAAENVKDVQVVHAGATRWWWLWLLPLLLAVLLFFVLTTSFGGLRPLVPGLDFKGPGLPFLTLDSDVAQNRLKELHDEETNLNKAIENLNGELAKRAKQCTQFGDQSQGGQKTITPEDVQKGDLSILKGRWVCDRGLANKKTRQPVIVIYEFDDKGQGRAIVREQGHEDCSGQATARFDKSNAALIIDTERQNCPDNEAYAAEAIECRTNFNDFARCMGKTKLKNESWGGTGAPFHRY